MKPERSVWFESLGSLAFIAVGMVLLIRMLDVDPVGVVDPIGTFGMPRFYAASLVLLGFTLIPYRELLERRRTVTEARRSEEVADDHFFRSLLPYSPIAGIGLYAFAIPRLGYVISTVVLGIVLLRVMGVRRILVLAAVPIGLTAFIWVIFGMLLNVNLPRGLLV